MTPIRITPKTPPEFPCWLWCSRNRLWFRLKDSCAFSPQIDAYWHPDQPTAPTEVPEDDAHMTVDEVREALAAPRRTDTERLEWLLTERGSTWFYWCIEHAEPINRAAIDREMDKETHP